MALAELQHCSLAELNALADPPANLLNKAAREAPKGCLEKYVQRCYDEARLARRDGNEESAYIFYWRCVGFLQLIVKASATLKKQDGAFQRKVHQMLTDSIGQLEALSDSLNRRYELRRQANVADSSSASQSNGHTGKTGAHTANGPASSAAESGIDAEALSIYPRQLYAALKANRGGGVLLLDIRPASARRRLLSMKLLPCDCDIVYVRPDAELLTGGCTSHKLLNSLPPVARMLLGRRAEKDLVVLVDECSSFVSCDELPRGTPARILSEALTNYSNDAKLKRKPLMMEGGFRSWEDHYPMHVTDNIDFKIDDRDSDYESASDSESFTVTVNYPDLDALDQPVQRAVSPVPPSSSSSEGSLPPVAPPTVPDRSLKPAGPPTVRASPSDEQRPSPLASESETSSIEAAGDAESKALDEQLPGVPAPAAVGVGVGGGGGGGQSTVATVYDEPAIQQRFDATVSRHIDARDQAEAIDRVFEGLDEKLHFRQPPAEGGGEQSCGNRPSAERRPAKPDLVRPAPDARPPPNENARPPSQPAAPQPPPIPNRSAKPPDQRIIPDRSTKPVDSNNNENDAKFLNEYHAALRNFEALACRGTYGKRGLTGLQNLGNTCFMNAVLQPLSHTARLRDVFMSLKFRAEINTSNRLGSQGQLSINFAALLTALWSNRFTYLNPTRFRTAVIRSGGSIFSDGRQHDAQEFLGTVLDGLHEDLNRVHKRVFVEQDNTGKDLVVAGREAWRNAKRFSESLIYDTFQGQIASVVRCDACRFESVTFDTFTQVTLELAGGGGRLDDCLRAHFAAERMSGDARWKCPRCDVLRDATKQMNFWRLPRTLVVHLKRFSKRGAYYAKKESLVDFPVNNFSVRPFLHPSSDHSSPNYRLYAITNHRGSLEHGHYTSVCSVDSNWYRFDDDAVYSHTGALQTEAAYILYYQAVENS